VLEETQGQNIAWK